LNVLVFDVLYIFGENVVKTIDNQSSIAESENG